jgi:hypothetical protein
MESIVPVRLDSRVHFVRFRQITVNPLHVKISDFVCQESTRILAPASRDIPECGVRPMSMNVRLCRVKMAVRVSMELIHFHVVVSLDFPVVYAKPI